MTNENWKPISGYEGFYEVSDLGRVRSLDRIIADKSGKKKHLKGRILKPGLNRRGSAKVRPLVVLTKDNIQKSAFVHVLVAETFIGKRPDGKECCHKNDISTDNRLCNLYWGTRSENLQDAIRNGLRLQVNATACKWGHEFTDRNTAWNGNQRQCRRCRTIRSRSRRMGTSMNIEIEKDRTDNPFLYILTGEPQENRYEP